MVESKCFSLSQSIGQFLSVTVLSLYVFFAFFRRLCDSLFLFPPLFIFQFLLFSPVHQTLFTLWFWTVLPARILSKGHRWMGKACPVLLCGEKSNRFDSTQGKVRKWTDSFHSRQWLKGPDDSYKCSPSIKWHKPAAFPIQKLGTHCTDLEMLKLNSNASKLSMT